MSKKRRVTDKEMDAICDWIEQDDEWYETFSHLLILYDTEEERQEGEDLYNSVLYMYASRVALQLENENFSDEDVQAILRSVGDSGNQQAFDAVWASIFSRQYQEEEHLAISDGILQGLKLSQGLRTRSKEASARGSQKMNERHRAIWESLEPWFEEFIAEKGRPAYTVNEGGAITLGRDFVEFCKPRFFKLGRPPVSDKTLVAIITKFHK